MSRRDFSVVLATYTGVDTISSTLGSILNQQKPDCKYEVIFVIDGPNPELRRIIEAAAEELTKKKVSSTINQFKKNRGRFSARLAGAKLAKYPYILVADDRVSLPDNTFKVFSASSEETIIPDVAERPAKNFISLTLNRLRRKIYGKHWNRDFRPYHIDKENFDKSPKGTAAFWVNRSKFIQVCQKLSSETSNSRYVNEDTRIMRGIIDSGMKIYKTSEIRLNYQPRSSAIEELVHMYHRAPRFIDYYFRPGTRYFWPLASFYFFLIPFAMILILWPKAIFFLLILSAVITIVLSELRSWPKIFAGLWLLAIFFGAGLISGLVKRLKG